MTGSAKQSRFACVRPRVGDGFVARRALRNDNIRVTACVALRQRIDAVDGLERKLAVCRMTSWFGVAGMSEKCQQPMSGTTRLTSKRFAKALRLGFILGAEPTVWPLCPSIAAATFHMVDASMAGEIRAGSKFSLD